MRLQQFMKRGAVEGVGRSRGIGQRRYAAPDAFAVRAERLERADHLGQALQKRHTGGGLEVAARLGDVLAHAAVCHDGFAERGTGGEGFGTDAFVRDRR